MDHDECRSLSDKIDNVILEARRLYFFSAVDNETSIDAIRKLWYLELMNPGKPILFVINSPGGSIDDGFAIWDQSKMITSPITTLVTGLAASMGSILSLCGAKGRRFATPQARFMIHQPSIGGPIRGQATDLDIQAKEIRNVKNRIVDLYVEATGKSKELITSKIDRDNWMDANGAIELGLVDKIVSSYKELEI